LKKSDVFVIIAVILNVIIMLYLIIFLPKFTVKEEKGEFTGCTDEILEQNKSDIVTNETAPIYIENIGEFTFSYDADFSASKVNNIVMDNINGKFKEIYTQSKETDIKKYFNNNKETIVEYLGINEFADFKELMEYFVVFDNDNNIKTCFLRENSLIINEETTQYVLDIVFNDSQQLSLIVQVNNLETNNIPLVKISPLKEDS